MEHVLVQFRAQKRKCRACLPQPVKMKSILQSISFKILITDDQEIYDEKFWISFYPKTHLGSISSDHSLRYSFVTN